MSEFRLFDPKDYPSKEVKDAISNLPKEPGNIIVCLRKGSSLPDIGIKPDKYPEYEGLQVIFIGESGKLQERFSNHFKGRGGNSTLRKSIGVMFGYKLDTKFSDEDEKALTKWMEDNIVIYYCKKNSENENEKKELINKYNPPLNLEGNKNPLNSKFISRIKELRNK